MVYKPMNARAISQKLLLGVIAACCFGGFLWALFPILGWSEYALEGALTSCSINWADRNSGVFSYVICIFIFVFAVPFSVIAGTNLKLVLLVRK
jgi:visual pigment-like receptor peropsin/c-opsin